MKDISRNVGIVGLGYVGLPLLLLAARKGYSVTGFDIDENKIESLNKKILPFRDEGLERELRASSYSATSDFKKISECGIVILCVPTPVHENRTPDFGPLERAAASIAPFLNRSRKPLVILESTVNPGITETVLLPILERGSGLSSKSGFLIAHCPERINPGDERWTIENISRVVGADGEEALETAAAFYRSLVSAEVKTMESLKEAEAVKIVENSFRDINIAFVNELARSFARMGIDVVNVIEGAKTKPFGFMPHYPSRGVGGHCIPVDPYYLIESARQNGFDHAFLSLARKINSDMPRYTSELVLAGLNYVRVPLKGTRVAVLGLAYKPEIDDIRESPAFPIIKHLKEWGAEVAAYDPFVPDHSNATDIESAVAGSAAVVVVTAHRAFRELTPSFFASRGISVFVDGMNAFDKKAFALEGILYLGIGREALPAAAILPRARTIKEKV